MAAAGSAYALEPRKRQKLLADTTMADVIPLKVDGWSAESSDGLVQPTDDESLAAKLYSELVGRIYHRADGAAVMMLAAYGDTQSDLLQLHRPESCYPAVGFRILSSETGTLRIRRADIPVRRVVAAAPQRQESILYWTRLGEYLPNTGGEQREARLASAMRGYVPDGVLARFSVLGEDAAAGFRLLNEFVPALIAAVDPRNRASLIGTRFAAEMRA